MNIDLLFALIKFLINIPIFGVVFIIVYFWIWGVFQNFLYGLPKSIIGLIKKENTYKPVAYYVMRSFAWIVCPVLILSLVGYLMAWIFPNALAFILNGWGITAQYLAILYVIIAQLFFESAKQNRQNEFKEVLSKY